MPAAANSIQLPSFKVYYTDDEMSMRSRVYITNLGLEFIIKTAFIYIVHEIIIKPVA